MFLNDEIIALMKQENCYIVGFADLRCLSKEVRQNFDYGNPCRYWLDWQMRNISNE